MFFTHLCGSGSFFDWKSWNESGNPLLQQGSRPLGHSPARLFQSRLLACDLARVCLNSAKISDQKEKSGSGLSLCKSECCNSDLWSHSKMVKTRSVHSSGEWNQMPIFKSSLTERIDAGPKESDVVKYMPLFYNHLVPYEHSEACGASWNGCICVGDVPFSTTVKYNELFHTKISLKWLWMLRRSREGYGTYSRPPVRGWTGSWPGRPSSVPCTSPRPLWKAGQI